MNKLTVSLIAATVIFATLRFGLKGAKSIIKDFEGLSLTPYKDQAGKWTIGYGHLIQKNDPYYPSGSIRKITKTEAEQLLENDIQKQIGAVDRYVKVPLTKNQRDALISLIFNIGPTAFANSTLLRKLNTNDFRGAANEFLRWTFAGGKELKGLINRRQKERKLFIS